MRGDKIKFLVRFLKSMFRYPMWLIMVMPVFIIFINGFSVFKLLIVFFVLAFPVYRFMRISLIHILRVSINDKLLEIEYLKFDKKKTYSENIGLINVKNNLDENGLGTFGGFIEIKSKDNKFYLKQYENKYWTESKLQEMYKYLKI